MFFDSQKKSESADPPLMFSQQVPNGKMAEVNCCDVVKDRKNESHSQTGLVIHRVALRFGIPGQARNFVPLSAIFCEL